MSTTEKVEEVKFMEWSQNLKLNDSLDVLDRNNRWCFAYINNYNINNNQISIHYYGLNGEYDEWIDKTNKQRLSPLNTHTASSELLPIPPKNMQISDVTHLLAYHSFNSKKYIIIAQTTYFILYDILFDEYLTIFHAQRDSISRCI